jgi:hypothetical protein
MFKEHIIIDRIVPTVKILASSDHKTCVPFLPAALNKVRASSHWIDNFGKSGKFDVKTAVKCIQYNLELCTFIFYELLTQKC